LARLNTLDGKTTEWKSRALRAYQRRTLVADALIAGTYLAGTNTRRVRRAQAHLQFINPSTSPNELNPALTPHSMIHGNARLAYFNKSWEIPERTSVAIRE
jgi:hypothetical protein